MQLFISLVTLVVAAVVMFVTWQRFKLDLFERRAGVVRRMEEILVDTQKTGSIDQIELFEFGRLQFQIKYLFGRKISDKSDKFFEALWDLYDNAGEDQADTFMFDTERFDAIFEDSMMISENPWVWITNKMK